MLVIATLPPDGPRLLRQGGFETRLYMNPDPSTFIDATRGERLEAAHDFRNAVAPFGPRLLRQGGFETRPYMNLDPTTLDPVCHIAYGRKWPIATGHLFGPIVDNGAPQAWLDLQPAQ